MDIKDAKQVIKELQTQQFICSDTEMRTQNYIITRKEVKKYGDKTRAEGKGNMHRSQA